MSATSRAISKARVRLFCQASLLWLGWFFLGAIALVLALLIFERSCLLVAPLPHWFYALPEAIAIAAALAVARLRGPSGKATAALIDKRLGLKDRLASALYAGTLGDDPFARVVIHDAERAASEAQIARAFPVRPSGVWACVAGAALLLTVAWALLPVNLWGLGWQQQRLIAARQAAQEKQQVAALQSQEAAAVRVIDTLEQAGALSPEDQIKKSDLAEFTDERLRGPQGDRELAAKLSAMNDKINDKAEKVAKQVETMQQAMMRLAPKTKGPADDFTQALQAGDFARAAKALQDLAEQTQSLPPDQREAMRQQLGELADQLTQAAHQQQQQTAEAITQTLEDAGVPPEQAQNLANQMAQGKMTQQQLQNALQQQGMSQNQAKQLAQQCQQQKSGQNQNNTSSLAQALQNMSQATTQPSGSPQTQPSGGQMAQAPQSQPSGGQMAQQPSGGQAPQTQPGGQSAAQTVQNAAAQGAQQLQQLAQMQQSLQQLRGASQQLQQMAQNAMSSSGACPNPGTIPGAGAQQQANGQPRGGKEPGSEPSNGVGAGIGNEPGGPVLGPRRPSYGAASTPTGDIGPGEGRVIASWLGKGGGAKNAPTVDFNTEVTKAKDDAERAVADDSTPYQYHQAIRDYFNQMPDDPQKAVAPSPPAAPR